MDRQDYSSNSTVPVVAGLVVGIAFVVMFAFLFSNTKVIFPEKPSYPANVVVEGLTKQYHVGEELDIMISAQGVVHKCSYPRAIITNTDTSEVLWDSGIQIILCVVDPENVRHPVEIEWILGDTYMENGRTSLLNLVDGIVPMKAGNYSLVFTYDEIESTTEFTIYP